jgi:hypothetical protein
MAVLLVMISVHLVNLLSDWALLDYGIYPRRAALWYHVLTAPFIHGSVWHLANNLLGFTIFGMLCALRSVRLFLLGSLFIILFSGTLVWLAGREALHIGASGWEAEPSEDLQDRAGLAICFRSCIIALWQACAARYELDRPHTLVVATVR